MRHIQIAVVAGVAALAACSSVKSSSVRTSGIKASITVSAGGDGTSVASSELFVGDSITDRVDLSAGDSLVASSGSQSHTMSRSNVLGIISYSTSFQGLDKGGEVYTIALQRTGDASAPGSTCTMPQAFAISAPAASASSSRTADLTVTYSPSGGSDPMTWRATGDCIKAIGTQSLAGDPGTFTIAKGTLQPSDAQHAASTCNVTVTVYRTRTGQLDPAYGYGGSIFAQQTRDVTFSSTP